MKKSNTMMKIVSYIALFMLSVCIEAQTYPLTPNVASLCQNSFTPINYFSGKASFTIPLYSTSQRDVPLDIYLNYNTGSIPINVLPTWVGHGWTLNAGGVISRSVVGLPDEANDIYVVSTEINSNSATNITNANYFKHSNAFAEIMRGTTNLQQAIDGSENYDVCPDVFSFNFMGKKGHFVFGHHGEWKVFSDDNIDVVFDVADNSNYINPFISTFPATSETGGSINMPKTIKGFTIVDESGTKYIFGGDQSSIEYTLDLFNATLYNNNRIPNRQLSNPWVATSWYLTRVEDRFGNVLYTFNYDRGPFFAQIFNSSLNHAGEGNVNFYYSGSLSAPVYLSSIQTLDGQDIIFNRSKNTQLSPSIMYSSFYENGQCRFADRYSNIERNRISKLCSYLQMSNYSQYHADAWDNSDPLKTTALMRLDSIIISNGMRNSDDTEATKTIGLNYSYNFRMLLSDVSITGGEDREDYSMTYNLPASTLPRQVDYLTTFVDSCGYYSNVNANYHHSNVVPDTVRSRYGVLTSIKYPTKGTTKIEYEQNRLNSTTLAYGVRIKCIKDCISNSPVISRRFTYSSETGPYQFEEHDPSVEIDGSSSLSTGQPIEFNNFPIIPLCTSFTQDMGYRYVIEKFSNGVSKKYNFRKSKKYPYMKNSVVYDPLCAWNLSEGKISSIETTLNGTLYEKQTYSYRPSMNSDSIIYAPISKLYIGYPSDRLYAFQGIALYRLYYQDYDVRKIVTQTKMGDNNLTMTTEYDCRDFMQDVNMPYSHRVQVRKCISEKRQMAGDVVKTSYVFPCMLQNSPYNYSSRLNEKQFCMPALSKSVSRNSAFVMKDSTSYKSWNEWIVPACDLKYTGNTQTAKTVKVYDTYTANGLIDKYTVPGHAPTKLLWNSQCQLLGMVSSSMNLDGLCCDQANGITNVTYNGNDIFTYPGVDASVFSYNGSMISAIKKGNGDVQYYRYDPLMRLTHVFDKNMNIISKYRYNYSHNSNNQ